MKVAIDISPLKTGHSVRGIGSYTERLINEFKSQKFGIEFDFFENPTTPPPADVIHYPYFDLFYRTLPLKIDYGRGVVTIHDVIPLVFPSHFLKGLRGFLNLFLQKKALSHIDTVICDSQTSKNDIASKLSFPLEKIHVIYLAPGLKFHKTKFPHQLSYVAKKYNLPQKFVLYVGDVNWHKNILNLLEAIKIAKVHLVMVGQAIIDKRNTQTQLIDQTIKELALSEKITKTGYVKESELIAIYNLAQLTILPSFYEGFGLPVLESMACGIPVICSKVASLAEIGGPAIFCDPTDPSDIAQKITHVFNLPQKERETLSQKSINHASKFTWHKVAKQTVKVYRKVYKSQSSLTRSPGE